MFIQGGIVIEQVTGQRLVRMELKYCEGCGGLLLRRAGDAVVYCGSCAAKLAELPQTSAEEREPAAAGGKRRSNTPPKQSLDGAPQADDDARYMKAVREGRESAGADADSLPKFPPRPAVAACGSTEQRRMA